MTFYLHVALVCALFVAVSARSDVIQASDVVVLDDKFVLPNDSAPAYDTLPLVSAHRRKRWIGRAIAGVARLVKGAMTAKKVLKGANAAKKVLKATKPGKNIPSTTGTPKKNKPVKSPQPKKSSGGWGWGGHLVEKDD